MIHDGNTARYDAMLEYCRRHNTLGEYEPLIQQWNDEELCNYALTICHMTDRMMMSFMEKLEFLGSLVLLDSLGILGSLGSPRTP